MGEIRHFLKKVVPTENQEQRSLIKWIKTQPMIRELVVKQTNEGQRSQGSGFNLKLLGMNVGASDVFLAYPTEIYAGLWLEIKRNKRYTPSERSTSTWIGQERFQELMRDVGYAASFCFGWEDGKRIIEEYLYTNHAA